MKTRTTLLLAFAVGAAGCGKSPEKPESAVSASQPAEAAAVAPAEDAETAARRFLDAWNGGFAGKPEDMLRLGKEGFLSDGMREMMEESAREAMQEESGLRVKLAFGRTVPEPQRAVFDVSGLEDDHDAGMMQLECKKTGGRWIVSNLGDAWMETKPFLMHWAVQTPETPVRSFFESYKWIPREGEGPNAAVVYCSKCATDAWLANCQWPIGEQEPMDAEDGDELYQWAEDWDWEWHSKETRPRWRRDPVKSPKESSIPWTTIRIDGVELPKDETRSPELFKKRYDKTELEGMVALVSASFLDDRGTTLFKRTFVVRPLNPNPPFWVIAGER